MKVTKAELKQIIKEELEGVVGMEAPAAAEDPETVKQAEMQLDAMTDEKFEAAMADPRLAAAVEAAAQEAQALQEGHWTPQDRAELATAGGVGLASGTALSVGLQTALALGKGAVIAKILGTTSVGIFMGVVGAAPLAGLGLALVAYAIAQKLQGDES